MKSRTQPFQAMRHERTGRCRSSLSVLCAKGCSCWRVIMFVDVESDPQPFVIFFLDFRSALKALFPLTSSVVTRQNGVRPMDTCFERRSISQSW